ncbi:MAG: SMC-Scp complex subunit ScpB [Nanoarchaeota archaeon]|nr:SMC-Scp complex subunit ScpB [Nanoarchaeota archaeon]|tara:strand:- start:788 stop:1441 length:654 start_codon:yes stop_codon:yes gene_type:complete
MDPKKQVESVLFAIGKEVTTARVASLCSLEEKEVEAHMEELIEEYSQRDHALKIEQRDLGWKMTVKDAFLPVVSQLVTETELDKSLMETLAVIAWKYPVVQSEIIKLRHNKAYDHIKQLMEMDFVAKEKYGRTYRLKLTKKFFEYFDLPSAEAKEAFLAQVPQDVLADARQVDLAASQLESLKQREASYMKPKEVAAAEAALEAELQDYVEEAELHV